MIRICIEDLCMHKRSVKKDDKEKSWFERMVLLFINQYKKSKKRKETLLKENETLN
jgi:hypothetical protein